jgi:hypothetical protein
MDIRYGALQEPKPGASADQCEDAFAYSDTRLLAAVCDGASNAFESRLWARLLAQGFVADSPLGLGDDGLLSWVDSIASRWSEAIPWQALSVFQEAKAREGSASTLVGLELTPSPRQSSTGTWRCLALGDSCLFRVSGGQLAEKLPVSRSADFSLSTPLLYTERYSNRQNISEAVQWQGTWQQGDCFFLLTDAIAQWFLREDERGASPWTTLMSLDDAGFPAFIKQERAKHQMRQDDVTAFMVGLGVPLATRRTPAPVAVQPVGADQPGGLGKPVAPPPPGRGARPVSARVGVTAGIGTNDSYPTSGPYQTRDHGGAGEAVQRTEWDHAARFRRRWVALAGACLLVLAVAIASFVFVRGHNPPPPPPPPPSSPPQQQAQDTVQSEAEGLARLLTTYPGGGAAAYQAYENQLASYVLNGDSGVVGRLTGSDSVPPSWFTSQPGGVTVAAVRSTRSQAELYLVVGQTVTYQGRSTTRDVPRLLLIHLYMTRQGKQWLVYDAQVQLLSVQDLSGQATGALVPPASAS